MDVALGAAQDRGDDESMVGKSSPKTPISPSKALEYSASNLPEEYLLGTGDHPDLILSSTF